MNSLKKGEGVPLLNFEGCPGVSLLNFEGGLGSRGPGPTFAPCLFSIKLQSWKPASLLRKDSNTDIFQWNLRNF